MICLQVIPWPSYILQEHVKYNHILPINAWIILVMINDGWSWTLLCLTWLSLTYHICLFILIFTYSLLQRTSCLSRASPLLPLMFDVSLFVHNKVLSTDCALLLLSLLWYIAESLHSLLAVSPREQCGWTTCCFFLDTKFPSNGDVVWTPRCVTSLYR